MAEAAVLREADPFYARHYPAAFIPPAVPFELQPGDRLALIGDSITEANRYSRMLECHLAIRRPECGVEIRNLGKGGESAEGFLKRMETDCLIHRPNVATICYGMNDAGYRTDNPAAVKAYAAAMKKIVSRLKREGVRVVLATPTCLGKVPPWEFVHEAGGTLEGINTSLLLIRDEAAAIAADEGLPFIDHFWNLYRARLDARARFGADYAICGADDGVHPSWAGHVVMAFGLFAALGLDGEVGSCAIDLETRHAATSGQHEFVKYVDNSYVFTSAVYPFCAEGLPDRDWSIRSGMALVPFNQRFNRMILKVSGAAAARYRVAWTNELRMLDEWHVFTGSDLESGINLADSFQRTPFSTCFQRMDDLVFQKQAIESAITWRDMDAHRTGDGLEALEADRSRILDRIASALVPVTHAIRLEAL